MTTPRSMIIAIVAASLVGIGVFWIRPGLFSGQHADLVRVTYQFFLVVVFGGLVSWLFQEVARQRDRERHEREQFFELCTELIKAYNESKTVKRLLRAKAWRTIAIEDGTRRDVLMTQPYFELLERLNSVQLEFESLKRHVKGRNKLFARVDTLYKGEGAGATLHGDLKKIEKYLGRVVKEFETALRRERETPEYIELEMLPKAREFVGPGKKADKREDAKDRFKSALEKLATVANSIVG